MRILIIDDCAVNRQVLSAFLASYGSCDTAGNGGIGLDLFMKAAKSPEPYALVCLDISMPGMNGYEVLDAMRRFEDERNAPPEAKAKVMIITAFSDEECLLKTYDKCQGYLIKPIRLPKLSEKLSMIGILPAPSGASGAGAKPSASPSDRHPQHEKAAYFDSVPILSVKEGRLVFSVRRLPSGALEEAEPGALEYFRNVLAGQLVARLDPSASAIPLGPGLGVSEDKGSVIASLSGRICIDGGELRLDEVARYPDGLRESLDFVGMVEIYGEVADGVTVKASKGIVIRGEAGACELKSEGDIEVSRFNGKERGVAKCGGSFSCDFLYGARVESRASVRIRKEALNSDVKAADSVKAGTFAGGSCTALNAIELDRAGSSKEINTFLTAGVNFHLLDRKATLEARMKAADTQMGMIRQMLGPYAEDIGLAVMLFEDKRRKVYDYANELRRLEGVRLDLQKEYDDVMALPHSKADPVITINDVLHKGVRLSVGDFCELVKDDLKGPFSVSENLIRL